MTGSRTKKGTGAAPPPQQRSNRARAVGDMLPDVGRASFRRFGFVQSSVVSRWAEIVGARYAHVSTPESIRFPAGERREGVLTLMVASAHAPMMQHVAPEIIERVNRFFGYPAVARLSIRQGLVGRAAAPRKAPPSLRPMPAELGDSLRTIGDPELRACLESLAGALGADEARTAPPPITPPISLPIIGKVR